LTSRVLVGNHPTYLIPTYHLHSARELALALALGPLMGVASAFFVRTINAFSIVLERGGTARQILSPIVAMLSIGAMAVWVPELLGNGYDTVNSALLGRLPLLLLLTLPILKLAATAGASGAGVPGGLFTPSLFFGALVGGALEQIAERVGLGGAPVGAFALLGMAGVLAGTTHAAVSAVLIVFEMTGNYDIILPLMLTSAVSAGVARRLEHTSLYTAVLHRRKVELPEAPHSHWLRSTHAQELVHPAPMTAYPTDPFEEVALMLLEASEGVDVYVTRRDGFFLGVIMLSAVKGHLPDHSLISNTQAGDVMDAHVPKVESSMSLAEVAKMFAKTTLENLPVVDAKGRLQGMLSKSDLLHHGRF
jgi:CIC family chloride channel protein